MDSLIDRISNLETRTFKGRVSAVNGLLVEAEGPAMAIAAGSSREGAKRDSLLPLNSRRLP